MKTMEVLNDLELTELSQEELAQVDGGWFMNFVRMSMRYEFCTFDSACPIYMA